MLPCFPVGANDADVTNVAACVCMARVAIDAETTIVGMDPDPNGKNLILIFDSINVQ